MFEIHEVTSSNILRLAYDDKTLTARCTFKAKDGSVGAVWEYSGMDREAFERWLNAPSVGSYFQKHVRNVYSGRKLSYWEKWR